MCHTRELAFQISKEYERFSKFLPNLKASIFCNLLSAEKSLRIRIQEGKKWPQKMKR
jgi:hypothetical protein